MQMMLLISTLSHFIQDKSLHAFFGGSYTDYPDWRKKKKAIINLKKTDNKCFQYDKCFKL